MDYFVDHFGTFLGLECGSTLAVYARVRELSDSIKNILIFSEDEGRAYRFGTT